MKKICLWCEKNLVIDCICGNPKCEELGQANICAECIPRVFKDTPITGQWSRHAAAELRAYEKDVLQPKNKDGTFNKKFVKAYGTKKLEKEYKTNVAEIGKVTY